MSYDSHMTNVGANHLTIGHMRVDVGARFENVVM